MNDIETTLSVDSLGQAERSPQIYARSDGQPAQPSRTHPHRKATRGLVKESSFKFKDRWEEIDRGEHADAFVVALKTRVRGGLEKIDRTDVEKVLVEQYPGARVRPNYTDMDNVLNVTPSNGLLFGTGQWAEYYGSDAQWHLGMIRRVLAKAPLNYRPTSGAEPIWEYSYNFGRGINVPPYLVRAPEEALKRAFGLRPFVFLQWALLRVESMVRFQEHHQRDFEQLNFQYAAEGMWEQFLHHPNNSDFKQHYESFDENARNKLVQHLMSVFAGMDRLSKLNQPGSRWDFKNQNISVYAYPSLLGSGWITCIIILVLQVAVPAFLLSGAVETSSRFVGLFQTSADQFCRSSGTTLSSPSLTTSRLEGLLMNIMVLLLYTIRVAPQILDTFYQATGEGGTPASRLNALRAVVWNKGADTFSMQFGFRLERLIKSVYICLVCIVMLFVLFLSANVLDIILNALAVEFVWQVDVEYAKSPYWDPKRRWIKAGAVECRIRATLDLQALSSPKAFCLAYGIDPEDYKDVFDGAMPSLKSATIAARDCQDERFMSETDVAWHWASLIAEERKLTNAQWQFSPHYSTFSYLQRALLALQLSSDSIFHRFAEYRTWSVWEEVLFLAPVPARGDLMTYPPQLMSTIEQLASQSSYDPRKAIPDDLEACMPCYTQVPLNNTEYMNFSPEFNIYSPQERFFWHILRTLRFGSLWENIAIAFAKGAYAAIPFRILDGLLEWISNVIQVTFPLILAAFATLNVICY